MTFFKPQISWKKVWILVGIVFLFTYSINFSIDIFISYDAYYRTDFFYYMSINLPIILFSTFYNISVVFFLNSNNILRKHVLFRFAVGILFVVILDFLQIIFFQMLGSNISLFDRIIRMIELNYIYTNSIQNYVSLIFAEFIYFTIKKQSEEVYLERVVAENEKYKYNQLKSQINPHFLFNSLNILSAMVYTRDPKESANYIGKLSDVYRYVLMNDEKAKITLREEIEFINKYGDILKTRFAEGFRLNIDLSGDCMERHILPMSIQLLVENAVKHNITSENNPLVINIYIEDDYIVVENNINARSSRIISTGIGLKNLSQRYKIASRKDISIVKNDMIYKVKVPLI